MRIGYIQFNPIFCAVDDNLATIARLLDSVEADLLVLPELATTGYTFTSRDEATVHSEPFETSESLERIQVQATKRETTIVVGFSERDGDTLYNSAALLRPDGTRERYRKIHLFAAENEWFTPGDEPFAVHDVNGVAIGMMICFDWFFPESARVLALKGADIICQPANLVLPWCQRSMVTRSIENRVFTVTANRVGTEMRGQFNYTFTGGSQVTAPDGSILISAPVDGESVAAVEIDPLRARDKRLNNWNDLIASRRPEFYRDIADTDNNKE